MMVTLGLRLLLLLLVLLFIFLTTEKVLDFINSLRKELGVDLNELLRHIILLHGQESD